MYDVIIIGSGPAGLAAAIYAKRAALKTLVLEKTPLSGGQIINTYEVDNYPGLPGISGMELGQKMRGHVDAEEAEVRTATVTAIEDKQSHKVVHTNQGDFEAKTVVLAMGASHRQLGVPGEEDLCGMGVSYCATCDGAFLKNRDVAVVGGGDVALEDALFLAWGCRKVYLIHRRDQLRGAISLQQKVFEKENIEFLPSKEIKEIIGKESVEKIILQDVGTTQTEEKNVDGIFVAVGMQPNSQMVSDIVKTDDNGYIIADESCKTSVEGIYAVGDVRTKQLRQVVTAVSDGAVAISTLEQDMLKNNG